MRVKKQARRRKVGKTSLFADSPKPKEEKKTVPAKEDKKAAKGIVICNSSSDDKGKDAKKSPTGKEEKKAPGKRTS